MIRLGILVYLLASVTRIVTWWILKECAWTEGLFKSALSSLRQLLASKSSWKMMENLFHVTLNALFILKIFLSWLLSLEEKRLDRRLWMMANLSIIKNGLIRKIRLISQLMTKNCNAHIIQYLKKYQWIKCGLLTKHNMTNSFLYTVFCGGEVILRPFSKNPKLIVSLDQ